MIYSANYGSWDPRRTQPVPVRLFTEKSHPLETTARYILPPQSRSRHHPAMPQTQDRLDAKWSGCSFHHFASSRSCVCGIAGWCRERDCGGRI